MSCESTWSFPMDVAVTADAAPKLQKNAVPVAGKLAPSSVTAVPPDTGPREGTREPKVTERSNRNAADDAEKSTPLFDTCNFLGNELEVHISGNEVYCTNALLLLHECFTVPGGANFGRS